MSADTPLVEPYSERVRSKSQPSYICRVLQKHVLQPENYLHRMASPFTLINRERSERDGIGSYYGGRDVERDVRGEPENGSPPTYYLLSFTSTLIGLVRIIETVGSASLSFFESAGFQKPSISMVSPILRLASAKASSQVFDSFSFLLTPGTSANFCGSGLRSSAVKKSLSPSFVTLPVRVSRMSSFRAA